MFLVASPHFGRLTLKWKQGLSVVFLSHSLCIYSSSDEECFQSCGVWYSVQSNRMLLGLLQNLEMGHPTQKSLNHTGSCRECRTITIALPMLFLFQVCQISSNQLFLGVVLSFLLWRLFICALGATVIGGESASILRHVWPHFCCMVSAFFLCHLFLHTEHFGVHGHHVILASP